jgi:hypothetical protein
MTTLPQDGRDPAHQEIDTALLDEQLHELDVPFTAGQVQGGCVP